MSFFNNIFISTVLCFGNIFTKTPSSIQLLFNFYKIFFMFNQEFFDLAYVQSLIASKNNELPVGAVLSMNDEIICKTYNQTNIKRDCLAHCEKIAIEELFKHLKESKQLEHKDKRMLDNSNISLYITLEPCVMCFGIIERLSKYINNSITVYYGVKNEIFGVEKILGSELFNKNKNVKMVCIEDRRVVEIIKEFYNKNRNERRLK